MLFYDLKLFTAEWKQGQAGQQRWDSSQHVEHPKMILDRAHLSLSLSGVTQPLTQSGVRDQ